MSNIKELVRKVRIEVLAFVSAGFLRLLNATMRWHRAGRAADPDFLDWGRPYILMFWHNRQLMMPFVWHQSRASGKLRLATLISGHSDGRIIARTVGHMQLDSVAGSSSKGGMQALREMAKKLSQGVNVAFTPDGPRGPRYKLKPGVVKLAQLTGAPVYPISYGAQRRWVFKSWDAMFLPKPFSRLVMTCGEPVMIPRDASEADLEKYAEELETRLNAVTKMADEYEYRS